MPKTPLYIAGASITRFGELWTEDLRSLSHQAVSGALQDAGLNQTDIEAVFVANKAGGGFMSQRHLNAFVAQLFEHYPPAMRVEGACASGGLAVLAAEQALLSGMYSTVMVVGVEKMTDVSASETTNILASAADVVKEYGSTFPGLYALLAQAHHQRYGTTRDHLSAVSVKNHQQAMSNPQAQFHKTFTMDQVSNSQLVADPLRMLDCSPISDGAASVILTTKKITDKPTITGFGHAQDSLDLAHRNTLTELAATKRAAADAFKMAGRQPSDVQAAELHDCFTIAEILAVEDLGFTEKGQGGVQALQRLDQDDFSLKNAPLINPSGGLKACGHPVGATGVKQLAFLSKFLEAQNLSVGLTHNVGGSGATAVVHVVEREES